MKISSLFFVFIFSLSSFVYAQRSGNVGNCGADGTWNSLTSSCSFPTKQNTTTKSVSTPTVKNNSQSSTSVKSGSQKGCYDTSTGTKQWSCDYCVVENNPAETTALRKRNGCPAVSSSTTTEADCKEK